MFDLRTSLEKRLLIFPVCACWGLALTTITSFSFSWSQSCRSPTCLCSRTLCMSWTSLMVLFLQRQQLPWWTGGLRQSSVSSAALESSVYLSGLASMCKLLRKSIRVKVSKWLKENIFTEMKPGWLENAVVSSWNAEAGLLPRPYLIFLLYLQGNEDKPSRILLKKCRRDKEVKVVGQSFVWGRSSSLYTG